MNLYYRDINDQIFGATFSKCLKSTKNPRKISLHSVPQVAHFCTGSLILTLAALHNPLLIRKVASITHREPQ